MSEDVKSGAVDIAMDLAQTVLSRAYGREVGLVMFVKEQDSFATVMASNMEGDMATKIVKGYVEHEEKRHEHN